MIRNVLFFVLLFGNLLSYGQDDYYSTDSLAHIGVKILDSGSFKNYQQCVIETDSGRVTLNPDVVKEFSLNGKIFISRKISTGDSIRSAFLRREVKDKINLYFYNGEEGKRFFLEKDSLHLIEIVRGKSGNSFREILKENTPGCEYAAEAIRLTGFTKSSLIAFCKFYNDCKDKPFPFNKFGIIIGFENTSINKDENISEPLLKNSNFNYDSHFLLGFFIDYPILQTQFSFHPEIFIQRNSFNWHNESAADITDAFVSSQSLNIPVLIRYTIPLNRIRPFFEAGPSMICNINENSKIFSLNIKDNVIELDELKVMKYSVISRFQPGFSLGAGIQVKLNYRNSLFLGTRYNKCPGANNSFGTDKIQILTGYNF